MVGEFAVNRARRFDSRGASFIEVAGERANVRAVLRIDMVGSTDLLVSLGVEVHIKMLSRLGGLVAFAASSHGGDVVDTSGDGSLLRFPSVTGALIAAIEISDAVAAAGGFDVRIGLDIAESDQGDTEAIERACIPGSVAVHDRFRRCVCAVAPGLEFDSLSGAACTLVTAPAEALELLAAARSNAELSVVVFSNSSDERASAISQRVLEQRDCDIVDTNGGGHVAVFRSAGGAWDAALQMHAMGSAEALVAHSSGPVRFRIGVSLGEVVTEQGRAFGHTVIEAARLHDHAAEGTTVVEAGAAAIAEGVGATSLGPVALKGFSERVELVALEATEAPPLVDLPAGLRRPSRFEFTGRGEQLRSLRSTWAAAMEGHLRSTVIIGEEGAGKTRLAEELASEVFGDGAVVLLGSCREEVDQPFQPIVDVLTSIAGADADVAAAKRGEGGPLGALFGAAPQDGATGVDRHELFEAVANSLVRLAALRPVLMVVDDVQWASLDTLQLLEGLVADTRPCRLMIVTTCRAEVLEQDHHARRLLDIRRSGVAAERLRVERLSRGEVAAMLESRIGRSLRGSEVALARNIASITGGSPLYAEELLSHYAATGVVAQVDGEWQLRAEPHELPIPESLIDLMRSRLRRLDADVIDTLTVAAVMGPTFDLEIVASASGRSLDDVLDAAEDAAADRLVRDDDRGEPSVFADELVRVALLGEIRRSRQSRIHRDIAEALERHRPHEFDLLARHWEQAVGTDAKRHAVSALGKVVQRDLKAAAYESVVERSGRIIALHRDIGDEDPGALGEANFALGSALRILGRTDYREPLVAAARNARSIGDGGLLGRAAAAMMRPGAWYPEAAVVDTEIVEMCEDALELLGDEHPLRPRVQAALATNLAYDPNVERRRSILREAQAGARTVGDPQLIATTLAAEAITEHAPDFFERRNELAAEVRRLGRVADDRHLMLTGGILMLLGEYERGEFDECEPLLAELEAMAEASRAYWPRFLIGHFRTAIALMRCEPDLGALIDADRDEFKDHEVDWFGVWLFQTAVLAQHNGDLSELLLSFGEASTMFDDGGWGLKWNYAIANAHMEAGHHALAIAAIEANPEPDFDRYWLVSVQMLGQLGLELDRPDYCELTIERLSPYQGRVCVVGLGVAMGQLVDIALGQAWLGLGEALKAEALLRDGLALAERIRAPYFAVMARKVLARALIEQERCEEATALLQVAAHDAREHGFVMEESATEQLLTTAKERQLDGGR